MKQRLADYVADFLVSHGITDCFTVVGGGAMHLNDALGHKEGLHCTYNHHEQASAMAAEAYARLNNKIAAVCVTTGPGGTNAITGVVGGWLDSIPMLILSGQVRYDTTARYCEQFTDENNLRAVGDQEFDITKSISCMCKYAVMIEDPKKIRYALERAFHLANTGRKGPCWIDIPVNFQGIEIETNPNGDSIAQALYHLIRDVAHFKTWEYQYVSFTCDVTVRSFGLCYRRNHSSICLQFTIQFQFRVHFMSQLGSLNYFVNYLMTGTTLGRETQHSYARICETCNALGCLCSTKGNLCQLIGIWHWSYSYITYHQYAILAILLLLRDKQQTTTYASDTRGTLDNLKSWTQSVAGSTQCT